jgi:hypothetical protein
VRISLSVSFTIKSADIETITIVLDRARAQGGIHTFESCASNTPRNLVRLERFQQTATEICEEAKLLI